MDSKRIDIAKEIIRILYNVDRELYSTLVFEIGYDPMKSLQIIAFWIWLEQTGFNNVMRTFLSLPTNLISGLAEDAMTCLECVKHAQFLLSPAAREIVELFKHPHLLLLQVRNSIYKLPGGRVRPGESDIECLKRKLTSKLSMNEHDSWEVVECIGMWWKADFETLLYPYLPPSIKSPKECTKLFLVRLPVSCKFIVPKNFNLLVIPLCQVHEDHQTYGPIISGVPQLLSKFSINVVEPER